MSRINGNGKSDYAQRVALERSAQQSERASSSGYKTRDSFTTSGASAPDSGSTSGPDLSAFGRSVGTRPAGYPGWNEAQVLDPKSLSPAVSAELKPRYVADFMQAHPQAELQLNTSASGSWFVRVQDPATGHYCETAISSLRDAQTVNTAMGWSAPASSGASTPYDPPTSSTTSTPAPSSVGAVTHVGNGAPAAAPQMYPGLVAMAAARMNVTVSPDAVATPDSKYDSATSIKAGNDWLDYPIQGGGTLVINERSGDSFVRAVNGSESAIKHAASDSAAIQALGANVPPPALGSAESSPATREALSLAPVGDPQTGRVPVKTLDIDYSSGFITQADVEKWKAQGYGNVVVGIQPPPAESPAMVREQLWMCQANGIKVNPYLFVNWSEAPGKGGTIEQQVDKAYQLVKDYNPKMMWLDVEQEVTGTRDPFDAGQLQDKLGRAIAELDRLNQQNGTHIEAGLYTCKGFWNDEMGNTTNFKDLPLWYAAYTKPENPTMSDWGSESFGGFHDIRAKQFNGGAYVGGARPRADEDVMYIPAEDATGP